MVLRLVRCSLEALSQLEDGFTDEEMEWMTIEAATSYFDTIEAEQLRSLGAMDCGVTLH